MPTHARMEENCFNQPIRSILPSLNSDANLWSISAEASLFEASERMTANRIDALVVLSAQKLDGIITEEDIREVTLQSRDSHQTRVCDIMTRGVYYVTPEKTRDECMLLMTSRRLRHLPVVEGSSVIGMISIADLLD